MKGMQFVFPLLETQRLIVRMASYRDVAQIVYYYQENKTFLTPFEPTRSDSFYTRKYWQEQIEINSLEFERDRSLRLFLFEKVAPQKVIGSVNFNQFVRGVFCACVLGYSLAEMKQGNGYMFEALNIAIPYLFSELHFHRILANYMPRNQRSGNLLRKLGFTVEGYARDYLLINGKWEDHILTSLINPHWQIGKI
jgi:ribosomal-protein-alanine N-acetyltransferase